MAQGDVTVFEEAKAYMLTGGWSSSDNIRIAVIDNTTSPHAGTATPQMSDFTQVGSSGTYTSGGPSLGTLGNCVSEAAGVMKFDSTINPSWAQHASNDTDAYWGIIYNDTDANDRAIAYVDLGGPVDMTAGTGLSITWSDSGIFTIT